MNSKSIASQIFLSGLNGVVPAKLIRDEVSLAEDMLRIQDFNFSLKGIKHIYLLGAGKASANMAMELERILGSRISGGHIVVKYGHQSQLRYTEVTEAGHPVPDLNSYRASRIILEFAHKATDEDLVICLLSGGGSSLMADLPMGISEQEMSLTNSLLLNSGADIKEINSVRKHLSRIKGGQLALAAHPARVISLILSDVIGNPLDVIASGPTVADPTTYKDAMEVIQKYQLEKTVPATVIHYLKNGVAGGFPETLKPENPVLHRVKNLIIGDNAKALEAARLQAIDLGFETKVLTSSLSGNTIEVTDNLIRNAIEMAGDSGTKHPLCLLLGGETTLRVEGSGKGGRNQHMALRAATLLENYEGITFLAAGTDGTDGPTPVAGAVVDAQTVREARAREINPWEYLGNYNSFHFFENAGGHIVTGPTLTNVMDMIVILVEKARIPH
ncbi:MAG: glycerate kinase [Bacteroidota bacterium]|nr:glycerate kinase [Bacteroidota bacterium]